MPSSSLKWTTIPETAIESRNIFCSGRRTRYQSWYARWSMRWASSASVVEQLPSWILKRLTTFLHVSVKSSTVAQVLNIEPIAVYTRRFSPSEKQENEKRKMLSSDSENIKNCYRAASLIRPPGTRFYKRISLLREVWDICHVAARISFVSELVL